MRTDRNYYDILHVHKTATQREIQRAFRKLARELHPDVNKGPDATRQFQELNEAYQVLGDPQARVLYDRFAHVWSQSGTQQAHQRAAAAEAARRRAEAEQRRQAEEMARQRRAREAAEAERRRRETEEAERIRQERAAWDELSRQREAEARTQWEAEQQRRREEEEAARIRWEQAEAERIERERLEYEEMARRAEAAAEEIRRQREQEARQRREAEQAARARWEQAEAERTERERQEYEDLRRQRETEAERQWNDYLRHSRFNPLTSYTDFIRQQTETSRKRQRVSLASALGQLSRRAWAVKSVRYGAFGAIGTVVVIAMLLAADVGNPATPGLANAPSATATTSTPVISANISTAAPTAIPSPTVTPYPSNTPDPTPTQFPLGEAPSGRIAYIMPSYSTGGNGALNLWVGRFESSPEFHFNRDKIDPMPVDGEVYMSPSWSPEGSTLYFEYMGALAWSTLTTGFGLLGRETGRDYSAPAISPDGRTFAWSIQSSENPDSANIFIASYVNRRMGDPVQITDLKGINTAPVWSPDGQKIAFHSKVGTIASQIAVMNRDGTDVKELTNSSNLNRAPSWSPDGTRITFFSDIDTQSRNPTGCHPKCGSEIYIMNADGADKTRITFTDGVTNRDPVWSPDGKWIAFYSNRDGLWGLYVMKPDGSQIIRLSDMRFEDPVFYDDKWGIAWHQ